VVIFGPLKGRTLRDELQKAEEIIEALRRKAYYYKIYYRLPKSKKERDDIDF
jgi:hypothetical protein